MATTNRVFLRTTPTASVMVSPNLALKAFLSCSPQVILGGFFTGLFRNILDIYVRCASVGAGDCHTNDGKNTTQFQPIFPASCKSSPGVQVHWY